MNLQEYFDRTSAADNQRIAVSDTTFVVSFSREDGLVYQLDLRTLLAFITFLRDKHSECMAAWNSEAEEKDAFTIYKESSYRAIYKVAGDSPELAALAATGRSQTRQLTCVLTKLIAFFAKSEYKGIDKNTLFDLTSVETAIAQIPRSFEELHPIVIFPASLRQEKILSEPAIKLEFQAWMKDVGGHPASTISQYSGSAIGTADRLYREQVPHFLGLYRLRSPDEVTRLLEKLDTSTEWKERNASGGGMFTAGVKKYATFLAQRSKTIPLPKPFLLLAGISGTGKTRFVREQARRAGLGDENYLLVPVRPDWHEPSDLLGYLSRIPDVHFVTTQLLSFIANAWRATNCAVEENGYRLSDLSNLVPFWVCLDEMNLAPVEQYFADFLSIVETRDWSGDLYNCAPLLHPRKLNLPPSALERLREELGFAAGDILWEHFATHGMPLPPNLIIAGTVNMDETAHGFSRKVIDRAFTLDFSEFFPNEFDKYFVSEKTPVSLTFPRWSRVTKEDLIDVAADPDGLESIKFLKDINAILKDSPFELAFRALNELLVSVRSFAPADKPALAAVFDDFLMAKLLPRLEGDEEKLDAIGEHDSLLTRLHQHVQATLTKLLPPEITSDGGPPNLQKRPDLLQSAATPLYVDLRTPKALMRMQSRLGKHHFTSFWP